MCVCVGGRQTFLQGMTGIKEDEEGCVSVCVCQWEGGREGGEGADGGVCLSWWIVQETAPKSN